MITFDEILENEQQLVTLIYQELGQVDESAMLGPKRLKSVFWGLNQSGTAQNSNHSVGFDEFKIVVHKV